MRNCEIQIQIWGLELVLLTLTYCNHKKTLSVELYYGGSTQQHYTDVQGMVFLMKVEYPPTSDWANAVNATHGTQNSVRQQMTSPWHSQSMETDADDACRRYHGNAT